MKKIKIVSGIGIGAIVTTSIAVPLSMMNNGDSVYITPGKKLVDVKIIESREYDTFKETFQDLKLGLTNINVTDISDDGDNLVLTATGVLPRATDSTHASFIVQSAAAIQANPNTIIKAIFNVVKTTGEVTLLKLLESGSKESEAVIKAAITENEVLNTIAMEEPTARMIDRITNLDNPFLLSSTLISAIKALNSVTALQGLLDTNEIVSNLADIDILNELIKVLPEGTIGKNQMLLSDIEITKNDETGVLTVRVTDANKSFIVSNFLIALDSETILFRVSAFERYFDSLQVTTFNEGVTADNDKAIYDKIKTDGVFAIGNSRNIDEMDLLFNAEGTRGVWKDHADNGLSTYNGVILLANNAQDAKKVNDQRYLNAEQTRVNNLGSNGATAKSADAVAQGNFDDNAQTKYGIILSSAVDGTFTYTYVATTKTITITAVLNNGAGDLTIPQPEPIDLSPTPTQNTEKEIAANLLAAKTTAKGFITTAFETAPSQDDDAYNVELFGEIALAKTAADLAIDEALDEAAVNILASSETVGLEVDKVLVAIELYKASKGPGAIAEDLENAKTNIKEYINTIMETAPTKDDNAHDAKLFSAITNAEKAAIDIIDDITDITIAQSIVESLSNLPALQSQVTQLVLAIKAYSESTGEKAIADALAITKTAAKGFITTIVANYAAVDTANHDASLFGAIALAKIEAYRVIDAATDEVEVNALASSTTVGIEVAKVLEAIRLYEASTGTIAIALENAKTASKAAFTTYFNNLISLAANAIPFAAKTTYDNIKTNGLSSINSASSIEDVEALFSTTNTGSLKTAADNGLATYNDAIAKANIDHDASLLTAARTASSEAFITYFNTLDTTSLEGDAIEPLAAKAAYENIKTNGLSSIDNALSIDDVEALFSTTNTGTLKTAADVGLETYNAAIENANTAAQEIATKKADNQRYLNDEQARVNRLVSSEAIAKIADAVAQGAFDSIAQSKYGITLGSAVEGAFTYTYVATAKTIAITAVLIGGADDLKILPAIPIDLSPTPAKNTATAIATAKTTAKGFITTAFATAPEQDDKAHNAELFVAIANAKAAADRAIDEALDEAAVNILASSETVGLEVDKVLEAITKYKESTGEKAIADALAITKATAKGFITTAFETAPEQDDKAHNAKLFAAIASAQTAANDAIDDAANINAVNVLASSENVGSEVLKVLAAIKEYKESTGTDKALADAKTASRNAFTTYFNALTKTNLVDGAVEPLAAKGTYENIKTDGLNSIDNAMSINDLNSLFNAEGDVGSLRDGADEGLVTYNKAIALANKKANDQRHLNDEQLRVNRLSSDGVTAKSPDAVAQGPFDNDAQSKYGITLGSATEGAFTYTYVASLTTITITAVLNDGANDLTIPGPEPINLSPTPAENTETAIATAKTTAKGFIATAVATAPSQDDDAYNAELFAAIASAQTAADRAIDEALDEVAVNILASSETVGLEVDKVLEAITKYKESTGTDKALADAKTKAKEFIATAFATAPEQDDKAHNAELFAAIASAQTAANDAIDDATNINAVNVLASSETVGSEVAKVLEAITKYKESTGTDKALADAKTTAKGFITTAFATAPSQDDKAHNAELFAAIASAQTAANDAIDDAANINAVNVLASSENVGSEVLKVLAAIKEYKESTGTDKALADAKTASRNAFTTYFNALTKTNLVDGAVEPLAAKGTYENIKTDGLNSIDNAMSINDLNSLFNAEGDVGSLRDGADEGLITYNKAIALANKKANDQRHLNDEQLRVNRLSSDGVTAKSPDAVAQGPFDNDAQSKYGITLGSATEGAFTYTYVASLTTITITAVLNNGAGDLTIPQPEPIDLSPTPAENTETAIATAKTTAKGFITTAFETAPSQDDDAYNAELFDAIALAKTAADRAIDEALDEAAVNILASSETVGLEVDKVLVAITKYKESTGTDKALADAKTKAKEFIATAFATAPEQDDKAHNAELFAAIASAQTAANDAIDDATNINAVNVLASSETVGSEVAKVLVAISEYKESTGTDKTLADAKTASSEAFANYFDDLIINSSPDNIIPFAAKTTYDNIKTNGLSNINSASSIEDVNNLFNIATNTGSLKTAADVGLETYNAVIAKANIDNDASLLTAARIAISEAFTTYFDTLVTTNLDVDAIEPSAAKTTYENIKTDGLSSINSASSIEDVEALFSITNTGSLKTNADDGLETYNAAIALANTAAQETAAKKANDQRYLNDEQLRVNNLSSDGVTAKSADAVAQGAFDSIAQSKYGITLGSAVEGAFTYTYVATAKTITITAVLNDGANDLTIPEPEPINLSPTPAENTATAIADYKKANDQKHLNDEQLRVNNLSSDGVTAKSADAVAQGTFDSIAQSKYGITLGSAAEGAFTYTYVATAKTITITAVLNDGANDLTIPEPEPINLRPTPAENTATELLLATKIASRGAFTAYFDDLTKTNLVDGAVEPLAAKTTYENIKTDGLNSIDNAMSINDLNSLFNAEGDVGSLRDGADAGLVTYNKAIALANKKANDQRHLDAEQLRVNNLVSNGATAKSADAVENGPFNSIAQSKYGITLDSAANGTFTYMYVATGTTITILAILTGGVDLILPSTKPIVLSPTPAQNTATEIETATNLLTAQTTAKGFIATAVATAPQQEGDAHNAELFDAIASAQTAANNAIDAALDIAAVRAFASSPTIGSEVDKVLAAINAYKALTGATTNSNIGFIDNSDSSIIRNGQTIKPTSKSFTYILPPNVDTQRVHIANLFISLITNTYGNIIEPLEPIFHIFVEEQGWIITNDKNAPAVNGNKITIKIPRKVTKGNPINISINVIIDSPLTDTKLAAKRFIAAIVADYATVDAANHDASLFGAIASAKAQADQAIDQAINEAAVNDLASSITTGSEVDKVLAAVRLYENSPGALEGSLTPIITISHPNPTTVNLGVRNLTDVTNDIPITILNGSIIKSTSANFNYELRPNVDIQRVHIANLFIITDANGNAIDFNIKYKKKVAGKKAVELNESDGSKANAGDIIIIIIPPMGEYEKIVLRITIF
ncbi:hypothetical protein [Candidatus Mycoplasma mahonii]|uniref:hypothetical protein n=1 Tax=Candidatus Mycoplasma mahonii TaxID=3004105 RepID=UPI0026EF9DAC|nr:hypothetical protein [Candidatus Mycoplasma mahonii]WKX02342.1 hypothetical protein O3I44_02970 [Candidatus Mycoplasma mahonii]